MGRRRRAAGWGVAVVVLVTLLVARLEKEDGARRAAGREPAAGTPRAPSPALAPTAGPRDPARTKAVAFIVDTSGSMSWDLHGRRRIDCAKEALLRILDLYERHDAEAHDLEAGLWCFGTESLANPLPLGAFSHEALRSAVTALDAPPEGTPFGTQLGTAIAAAEEALLARAAPTRAIVFLTDGESNRGPAPEEVVRAMNERARSSGSKGTDLYLVAFNVERRHFEGLAALGARVEEARDVDSLTRVFADYSAAILEEPLPPEPAPR